MIAMLFACGETVKNAWYATQLQQKCPMTWTDRFFASPEREAIKDSVCCNTLDGSL